jgi:hypothetical protein
MEIIILCFLALTLSSAPRKKLKELRYVLFAMALLIVAVQGPLR